jgi:hypothetical protein
MKMISLSSEEIRQHGYTNKIVVELSDLKTQTSPFKLIALNAGQVVRAAAMRLDVPLANSQDADFKKCTITIGDSGKADKYLIATETNKNGTYVKYKAGNVSPTAYTADDRIQLKVEPQAEKSLSSLTQGQISIYVSIGDLSVL